MDEENDTYDPDKALEEFGYGKTGKGKTVAIVLLVILLFAAVGSALFIGKLWSEEQSKTLTLENQVKETMLKTSTLENKNAELSSLLADKQTELERMREEWETQVSTLREQHKDQLQRTYGQMNEILYDSKKTLSYIGDIETRLRDGQNLDRDEALQLQNVVNGLAFLHEQYKKPLNEFRELDRYFNQQLAALPSSRVDPIESTPLGKRIFQNKKFKEERARYFQNEGRRSALTEARNRVKSAYASAQRQMEGLSLDLNKYLAQLDAVVESNENSSESVEEFFETSKEILKIHDRIMSIDPPSGGSVKP